MWPPAPQSNLANSRPKRFWLKAERCGEMGFGNSTRLSFPRRRNSLRLRAYDYTRDNAYFVTLCSWEKRCLFGAVEDDSVPLNAAGRMIARWWRRLPTKFSHLVLDEFLVMPNHLHGILIVGSIPWIQPVSRIAPGGHTGPPVREEEIGSGRAGPSNRSDERRVSLSDVVGWFKTMTTNNYLRLAAAGAVPARLWHRGFYDHVIRDRADLLRVRGYIRENPFRWFAQ